MLTKIDWRLTKRRADEVHNTAADRQRRRYERRGAGRFCVTIEIDGDLVDELLDRGLLAAWDRGDRDKIRRALEQMHRQFLTREDAADTESDRPIPEDGKRDYEPPTAVPKRHLLLRQLARTIASTGSDGDAAPKVWAELEIYRTSRWRENRFAARCPCVADSAAAICWHIFKINTQPPNLEVIEEALKWQMKL